MVFSLVVHNNTQKSCIFSCRPSGTAKTANYNPDGNGKLLSGWILAVNEIKDSKKFSFWCSAQQLSRQINKPVEGLLGVCHSA
jgi:hypothetical protein